LLVFTYFESSEAEVADLDGEGVVDEDVVTLDISMDDAERVHVEEGAGDISSDAQSHLLLELNSLF
jgi:hypothetical protein